LHKTEEESARNVRPCTEQFGHNAQMETDAQQRRFLREALCLTLQQPLSIHTEHIMMPGKRPLPARAETAPYQEERY